METIYFYDKKIDKDVTKILGHDDFMRVSYIVRESNVVHYRKEGYVLYIQASPDEIDLIEQKLKELGAEKIVGAEERTIIDTIKKEEEDSARGIGMIFGTA